MGLSLRGQEFKSWRSVNQQGESSWRVSVKTLALSCSGGLFVPGNHEALSKHMLAQLTVQKGNLEGKGRLVSIRFQGIFTDSSSSTQKYPRDPLKY